MQRYQMAFNNPLGEHMKATPDGNYVLYSDTKAIEEDRDRLKAELTTEKQRNRCGEMVIRENERMTKELVEARTVINNMKREMQRREDYLDSILV